MTKRVYVVRIPIVGTDQMYDLCRCDDTDKIAALIKALIDANNNAPYRVEIVTQLAE